MKKLLAMVLCVVMVLSLAPMAFADQARFPAHPEIDYGLLAPSASTAANNKAVKDAKANIEYMYGTLAADTAVFGTIQSVDSIITDFTKNLFDGVDSFMGVSGSTVKNNTTTVLRDYIGSEIIRDLMDNRSKYETASFDYRVVLDDGTVGSLTYTGHRTPLGSYIYVAGDGDIYCLAADGSWWLAADGSTVSEVELGLAAGTAADALVAERTRYKYDPIAYANAFASAATKAISGKEGISQLEALAYNLYAAKVLNDMTKDGGAFATLRDEILDWEDGNAILSQYHFHDTYNPVLGGDWTLGFDAHGLWTPYAFLNVNNYPNTFPNFGDILAP